MKKPNLLQNTDSMTVSESTLFTHKHGGYFFVLLTNKEKNWIDDTGAVYMLSLNDDQANSKIEYQQTHGTAQVQ